MEMSKYASYEGINEEAELLQQIKSGEFVEYNWNKRFVFSSTSTLDKYTTGCAQCLALVLTGNDKINSFPVSSLSHISPSMIDYLFRDMFNQEFQSVLHDFKTMAKSDSIEAFILGGGLGSINSGVWIRFVKLPLVYRRMVSTINSHLSSILGVKSQILLPPKKSALITDVYLATAQTKLIAVES